MTKAMLPASSQLINATMVILLGITMVLPSCDMSDKDNKGISPTRVVGKALGHKESYRPIWPDKKQD